MMATLQAQIEATLDEQYPVGGIDHRIISGLGTGEYYECIDGDDFGVILRHVVHAIFDQKRVVGLDVGIIHNVAKMDATIKKGRIHISFVVHVHKPIIAFLNFSYVLINHPQNEGQLGLKKGSLRVEDKTRRFDLKAKTALKAMQTTRIARQELSNLSNVLKKTWPRHLQMIGYDGELTAVHLHIEDTELCISLAGQAKRVSM